MLQYDRYMNTSIFPTADYFVYLIAIVILSPIRAMSNFQLGRFCLNRVKVLESVIVIDRE
jgi:hypothetical protein